MKTKILVVLLLALGFASCDKDDDTVNRRTFLGWWLGRKP